MIFLWGSPSRSCPLLLKKSTIRKTYRCPVVRRTFWTPGRRIAVLAGWGSRGWVDPVAEKKGAILGMDAGLSTLEMESAENAGEDWEEMLDQRAREIAAFKERGSRFRAGHRLKSRT